MMPVDPMAFPNFRNKHAHKALVTPRAYLAYARSRGTVPQGRPPEGLIIAYHKNLMRYVLQHHRASQLPKSVPGSHCHGSIPLQTAIRPFSGE